MKKRLFSFLLSLAVVVTMIPAMASVSFAEEGSTTVPVELVKATTTDSGAVKLSWIKVPGATKYVVYGNKCGSSVKKLATVKTTKYTVKKIKKTKLKAHKNYKFYVVAYDGNTRIVKSKTIHYITSNTNGKYANAKSIKVSPTSITLRPGQEENLKVTTKIYKNKKHISKDHGVATRYISNNPEVASVSSKGVVTAKNEGTATIYVEDIGGLWCKTEIIVAKARYTVSFDMQHHGKEIESQTIKDGEKVVKPQKQSATGYTFGGWYKEPECKTAWNFDVDTITADTVLYAKWTANTYFVYYDSNGGSGKMMSQTFTYDEPQRLRKNTFTRAGYHFIGWSIHKKSKFALFHDRHLVQNLSSVQGGIVVLYAVWAEKDDVIITYESNNDVAGSVSTASEALPPATGIAEGSTAIPNIGYHFVNWTNAKGTEVSKKEEYVPEKVGGLNVAAKYTANFTANTYKVKFDGNGNTSSWLNPELDETYDAKYILPGTNPEKTGYTFAGWFTEKTDGTEVTAETDVKITADTTLYAHWTANKYTVTFDKNTGDTDADPKEIDETYDAKYTLPTTNPTKTGYTFAGWYTDATNGEKVTESTDVKITSAQTLYAHWTADTYTVTFVGNYENSDYSVEVNETYDAKYDLPNSNPERTGYTFAGWYTGATDGTEVTTSTDVKITAVQTLYAHWTANTYTVSFDANTGSGEAMTSQNFTYDVSQNLTKNTYTKPGYNFIGWNTDKNATTAQHADEGEGLNLTSENNGSVTLFAIWTEKDNVTITYLSESEIKGSVNPAAEGIAPATGTANGSTASANAGYTFKNWTDAEGKDVSTSVTYVPGKDKDNLNYEATYTAHFTANTYTVTFDKNTGDTEANPSSINETYDAKYTLPTTNPTKTGYTFAGWYTDVTNGTQVTSETDVKTASAHTLYAHWTANTYKVTFVGNYKNSDYSTDVTETYDAKYTLPTTNPTKTGYTFAGWYTGATDGTEVTTSTDVKITEATTLYAHWTANTYTITYKDQGDAAFSGTHANNHPTTHTYDAATTLMDATRAGYTFGGWFTKSDCSGSAITTLGATDYTDNITLYAKWTANTNTAYKVEHYQQNVDGNGYTVVANDTENLTGTTDTTASATAKTYEGFTENTTHADRLSSGNIAGDGSLVLKLYYDRNSYSVTYSYSGTVPTGASSVPEQKSYKYGAEVSVENAGSATGYTFAGWTSSDVSISNSKFTMPAKDVAITGSFTVDNYNIIYKDGGDANFSGTHENGYPTAHTYGTDTTLKSATKTGYTFGGWFSSSDCSGSAVTILGATDYTADITLYAKWTANKYTVTFDKNTGDTEANPKTVEETYDAKYTLPTTAPTKTGYTFAGWFTGATDGTEVTTSTDVKITAVQTLYAHWTANKYTVTFDKNGGNKEADPKTVDETYDANYTLPTTAPTKAGYTFAGWFTATTGGTQVTSSTKVTITATQTLYAQWTENTATLTYDANGHGTAPTAVTMKYAGAVNAASAITGVTGYTFNGWNTKNDGTGTAYAAGAQVKAANTDPTATTLYAQWTANTYSITYKDQGNANFSGTHADDHPTTHTYGTATTLKSATKTAYSLEGWYLKSDCSGSAVTSLGATAYTDNITLYAKWVEKSATLTYDANGHGTAPTAVTMKYADAVNAASAISAAGYKFTGWNTVAAPTEDNPGTSYAAGAQVKAANTDPVATTLYAQWSADIEGKYIQFTDASNLGNFYVMDYDAKTNQATVVCTKIGDNVKYYATESVSTVSISSKVCLKYSDSMLDTWMINYYNSLPESIKNNIQEKEISQSVYSDSKGDKYYTSVPIGKRYVYALDVEDIKDFSGDLMKRVFGSQSECWLRSDGTPNNHNVLYINEGQIDWTDVNTNSTIDIYDAHPAFVIDLTDIDYLIGMPQKGDIITLDTENTGYKKYIVLNINGTTATLLNRDSTTTTKYANSDSITKYSGSVLDTACNTTFYNGLSRAVQDAIIESEISVYKYDWGSEATNHKSRATYNTKASNEQTIKRKVYSLDVDDVEEYFGGSFTSDDLIGLFALPKFTTSGVVSYYEVWLRSICNGGSAEGGPSPWKVQLRKDKSDYKYCYIENGVKATDSENIRPTFTIDLAAKDIEFTVKGDSDPYETLEKECVTGDTLVTLSDGTQKQIKDVNYNDKLLAYNLDTGLFEETSIAKIYYHGDDLYRVIKLIFDNGNEVDIIGEHSFLNKTKEEFSQINIDNYQNYIGDEFMTSDGLFSKLIDVQVSEEYTGSYSIITTNDNNFITNGFVSLTGGRYEFFKIGGDMKYDAKQKQADIEKYGLFKYEDWSDYFTEEEFYGLNCQYYKIPLQKGLIDMDYIYQMIPKILTNDVVEKE